MKKITILLLFICGVILIGCGDDKPKDVYKNKNQDAPKAEQTGNDKPTQDANATVIPAEEISGYRWSRRKRKV